MKMLMNILSALADWWKRLRCEHDYQFHRNIYGDEIIHCGWNRSIWKCRKCKDFEYRKSLYKLPPDFRTAKTVNKSKATHLRRVK